MGFSAKQVKALRRNLDQRYVRTREAHGRELSYIEGWYAISEANRIFGFDGWSRETVESRCVLARENRGAFLAVYTARVRVSVQAGGSTIIREGHGSGEGRGASPGEVHDTALKAAETDATKRALATFGKPFGLALYGLGKPPSIQPTMPIPSDQAEPVQRFGFHPDDTTPHSTAIALLRRRHYAPLMEQLRKTSTEQKQTSLALPLVPNGLDPISGRIDKNQLVIAEPKRLRDKAHLKYVASQPCLICGRQPSDPHHLRYAQPPAIGLKVSDEFAVPLCRGHHRQLHQAGNELGWWENLKIDAIGIAKDLWKQTHSKDGRVEPFAQSTTINSDETMAKH
jgi:DNA recombination protein Rad52